MPDSIYDSLDIALQCVEQYSEGFRRNAKEGDIDVAAEHLTDTLTDMRHACRLAGIDFDRAVRLSAYHFNAEQKGKTK
jgi:hypothetical protein